MNTLEQFTLLADLEDMVKFWGPIIFAVLYGVAHLVSGWQEEKRKAQQRPRPQPAPQADPMAAAGPAPGQGGAKPATLEDTLRREVEEFLRRAQGQQAQPPQPRSPLPSAGQPARTAPPRPQPPRTASPQRPPQRREPNRRTEQPEPPTRRLTDDVRPSMAQIPPIASPTTFAEQSRPQGVPLGSGVGQHVAKHLGGSQAVVAHAQQLGVEVAQADERMEEHLREKFAHQFGALTPATAAVGGQAAVSPAVQELRTLLAQPNGMRQIIIASEILRRPDERWDF